MEYDEIIHDSRDLPRRVGQENLHPDRIQDAVPHVRGGSLGVAATPSTVLRLQRLAGNSAVARVLSGLAEDREVEAGSEDGASRRSPVVDVVGRGGGEPLDGRTRQSMERALGADLGQVRVHDDQAASASAQAIDARAYTVGEEIVFQSGSYRPDTLDGQRMLAHELTHVIQQRQGPVDATPTGDGIAVSHPSDRFEQAAEANADRIVAGGKTGDAGLAMAGRLAGGVAQRQVADDEEAEAEEQMAEAEEQMAGAEMEALEEEEEQPLQGSWLR
jgi:Domain of unknown function (DUF4157)